MGKNIIITGGTSGIGKAIVKKILKESNEESDRIIVNYGHNVEVAEEFRLELNGVERKKIDFLKADLSNYENMIEFKNEILEKYNKIDWLILNTGVGTYEKFEDYTFDEWNRVMTTNLSVPAFLVKELKPYFCRRGKILFMGSYAGEATYSSSIVYSVSKAAVHHLAKCLLKVFDEQEVSINAIAPGFIETPWQKNRTEDSYERINKKIALHRFGSDEEVANLSYSVLCNDYINGSVLEIHGGYDYY